MCWQVSVRRRSAMREQAKQRPCAISSNARRRIWNFPIGANMETAATKIADVLASIGAQTVCDAGTGEATSLRHIIERAPQDMEFSDRSQHGNGGNENSGCVGKYRCADGLRCGNRRSNVLAPYHRTRAAGYGIFRSEPTWKRRQRK